MADNSETLRRCSCCKCTILLKFFKINRKGLHLKTCTPCRVRKKANADRNKCEHKKRRERCKECGGGSICEHKIQRQQCKNCKPDGHLLMIVSRRINKALKNKKNKSSLEYLGCDIEKFKKHISDQFKDNMTWENYGEWHIDHIIPLKYQSPTIEETISRLHYTNTQPLWAAENRAKGNRFIG